MEEGQEQKRRDRESENEDSKKKRRMEEEQEEKEGKPGRVADRPVAKPSSQGHGVPPPPPFHFCAPPPPPHFANCHDLTFLLGITYSQLS